MDTPTPVQPAPLVSRSETIKEIAMALSKFQSSIENVKKDEENPFFKSNYATLGNIIDTIRKPLGENGLSFAQFPIEENRLVTLLMHTSGEYFQSVVKMFPRDNTPQSQGSAITYMRRYALSSILGIATEDDDGNTASQPATKVATAIVKNMKDSSMDVYTQAMSAITKAKTQDALFKLQENIEKSDKLSDTQKDTLDKMISTKVDELELPTQK